MATTWLKPIRAAKGKSAAKTLRNSLDYILNPEKTRGRELVKAFACDQRTAASEFYLSKQEYHAMAGKEWRGKNGGGRGDVLMYHMRQSFKPGEITAEQANEIGYALAMRFLQENNLDEMDKLQESAQEAKDNFNDIQNRINAADSRLNEISTLQKHIGSYVKTRGIYVQYRKSGYSKKFFEAHEAQITAHKAAKTFFDEQKFDKLPTMKSLREEYAAVLTEKKSAYSEYHKARKFMQEILKAKQNAEMFLNYKDKESSKEISRASR